MEWDIPFGYEDKPKSKKPKSKSFGNINKKVAAQEVLKQCKTINILSIVLIIGAFVIYALCMFNKSTGLVGVFGVVLPAGYYYNINKKTMLHLKEKYKL